MSIVEGYEAATTQKRRSGPFPLCPFEAHRPLFPLALASGVPPVWLLVVVLGRCPWSLPLAVLLGYVPGITRRVAHRVTSRVACGGTRVTFGATTRCIRSPGW